MSALQKQRQENHSKFKIKLGYRDPILKKLNKIIGGQSMAQPVKVLVM